MLFICDTSQYLHNMNVVLWSQTLRSGEEGHQTTVGKSSEKRLLNRFRNITACESMFVLTMFLKEIVRFFMFILVLIKKNLVTLLGQMMIIVLF